MGILARMKMKALAVTDEKAWDRSLWNMIGSQSLSGEQVNEYTSLTYSAFWNAIVQLSGPIGTLPLHLLQKKGRSTVHATNKPIYRVMHDQCNPYATASSVRSALMAHVLTWGNAYAEKILDPMGRVQEIWPITPHRVSPRWGANGIEYVIRVDNESITMSKDRILHLHGLGYDGLTGYSIVSMARKSIGLGMAMETFGSLYFGSGTHPGMIVKHPTKLSAQGHDNLQRSLTEKYSGLGQSHRILLLEEGMSAEKVAIPLNDAQFLESRQFQIPEMARWFNIPPHKLKDLSKSSFSNIESEQRSFYIDSILPWLVMLEQQYNTQLLTLQEQTKENLYFNHNVDGILRANQTDRARFYQIMFNIGGMSINDILEKENMDPLKDKMADEHFVPLNMVPLSKVEEYLSQKTTSSTTAKDDKANEEQGNGLTKTQETTEDET
jgi:HK97 family phage portal protein